MPALENIRQCEGQFIGFTPYSRSSTSVKYMLLR
jgi:hypothetical protein